MENGRPLSESELAAFRAAYIEEAARAEVAILIGSLPAGVPVAFYRELVAATRCPMVLDFRGEGLLSVLDLKPYVVKPNREELGQTLACALDDDASLVAAMRELNRRGAQWVVITQGSQAVWVSFFGVTLSPRAAADRRSCQSDRLRRLPGRWHSLGHPARRCDSGCGAIRNWGSGG